MTTQHSGGPPHDAEGADPIDITPGPDVAWGDGSARRDVAAPDGGGAAPAAAAVRKPSRTRLALLGSLLAAGVAGAGVLGTAAWRIAQQKDATLEPPASAAGFERDESAGAVETAEYLRTALAARVDLDDTTAAVYLDPADEARSVLFFGGTALLFTPGDELDGALELLRDQGAPVDMREVDAGGLGGVMKCGALDAPEGALAVCGWADHGSVALAMFQGRTPADAEPLMRELREAIQHRP